MQVVDNSIGSFIAAVLLGVATLDLIWSFIANRYEKAGEMM